MNSSDVAIISPIKFLSDYCNTTRLQLCYTDIAIKNPEYVNFYCEKVKSGNIVILDSSPRIPRSPISEVFTNEIIKKINPTYVVLPDVDFSWEKTCLLIEEYREVSTVKTIGVLQGVDEKSIKMCYKEIKDYCDVIGLPVSNEKVMNRNDIIRKLKIDKPCIFLGVYKNPIEEIPVCNNIIGLCTDLPVRLGIDLRKLFEYYPEPPVLDFYLDEIPLPELVSSNIMNYLDLVQGG